MYSLSRNRIRALSIFVALIFSVNLSMAAINEPVPDGSKVYTVLESLSEEGLLGEASDLYQKGIILTRREAAKLFAVSLTELENLPHARFTLMEQKVLRGLEEMTIEFSEELEMLYSYNIESLSKKITLLEKAISDSKLGTALDAELTKPESNAVSLSDDGTYKLAKAPKIKQEPLLVMQYNAEDPVLNQLATLNFVKTELSMVLSTLFAETGYSIVSGDLRERITIQVEAKPIIEVLKSLAESSRFDFKVDNGIVTITPLVTQRTEIVKLQYAEAQEVMSLIDAYKEKGDSIKIDKRTNSLIITAQIKSLRKMKSLVSEIDVESEKTKKILHTFQLSYVDPADVETIINTLKSSEGLLQFNSKDGTIIAVDYIENVNKIGEYLKKLDVPIETKQMKTEIYNVRYANSDELITLLQSDVFKLHEDFKDIQMSSDPRTNSLLLSGRPAVLHSMKKYIKQLDSRIRQVVIAAKIIEVNLDDKHSEGVNWEKLIPRKSTEKDSSEENNMKALLFDQTTNSFTYSFKFGTLDNEQFTALLNALKTHSDVKVVSNPTITTLDNVEARIQVGEKIGFEETTTSSTGTSSKVTFKDVGIILTVTPVISADNFITLKVHPEISQQSGQTSTGEPVIGSTEADTQVLIRNGDTLVIGGLVKETKSHLTNKVPLLGDIPGLGRMFRFNSMSVDRVETLIFITPTIVDYEEGNPYEISEYFE